MIANVASAQLFFGPMANVVDGAPKSGTKILAASHDRYSIVWVWECTVGSFIWHYGEDETVYIISGEVFISTENGQERRLGEGDMAVFPGGVSCRWRVTAPVKKLPSPERTYRFLGFRRASLPQACPDHGAEAAESNVFVKRRPSKATTRNKCFNPTFAAQPDSSARPQHN